MVIGGDSCSKGCGFELWHLILDGHFFALKCKKINYVSLKRPNINDIRGRDWLIYLIKTICLPTTTNCSYDCLTFYCIFALIWTAPKQQHTLWSTKNQEKNVSDFIARKNEQFLWRIRLNCDNATEATAAATDGVKKRTWEYLPPSHHKRLSLRKRERGI